VAWMPRRSRYLVAADNGALPGRMYLRTRESVGAALLDHCGMNLADSIRDALVFTMDLPKGVAQAVLRHSTNHDGENVLALVRRLRIADVIDTIEGACDAMGWARVALQRKYYEGKFPEGAIGRVLEYVGMEVPRLHAAAWNIASVKLDAEGWDNASAQVRRTAVIRNLGKAAGRLQYSWSRERFDMLDIVAQTDMDMSPLHMACTFGSVKDVRRALRMRAVDANMTNAEGQTAAHVVANHSTHDLKEVGTRVKLELIRARELIFMALSNAGANLDVRDNQGMTPLHHAVDAQEVSTVKQLVRLGVDMDVEDNFEGDATPLDRAVEGRYDAVAESLDGCSSNYASATESDRQRVLDVVTEAAENQSKPMHISARALRYHEIVQALSTSWVQCDECHQWRELPPHVKIEQSAPFKCSDNDWQPWHGDGGPCGQPEDPEVGRGYHHPEGAVVRVMWPSSDCGEPLDCVAKITRRKYMPKHDPDRQWWYLLEWEDGGKPLWSRLMHLQHWVRNEELWKHDPPQLVWEDHVNGSEPPAGDPQTYVSDMRGKEMSTPRTPHALAMGEGSKMSWPKELLVKSGADN